MVASIRLTKARLVASADKHPPFLRLGSLRADWGIQRLLPVVQRQDVRLHGAGLGLCGVDGIMSVGIGNVRSKVADKILELSLVLLKVLRRGEEGQSCEDRGC